MAITASDIYSVRFSKEFRGYNKSAVDQLMQDAAESIQNLTSDKAQLSSELNQVSEELARLKALEDSLQKMLREADEKAIKILQDAQTLADKKVDDAKQKAEEIEKNAQIESDDVMITAKAEANFLLKETNETIEKLKKDAQADLYQSELEYQSLDVAKQQLLNDMNNLLGYTNTRLANIQTKYDPDTFNAKKLKLNVLKKAKVLEPEQKVEEIAQTNTKAKAKLNPKAKPNSKPKPVVNVVPKTKLPDNDPEEMDGLPTVSKIIASETTTPTVEIHKPTVEIVQQIQQGSGGSFFDSI
jgi:DivIVA domain-containing protein